ncbi:MAG: hypothetical protein ACEQSR_00650 [Candidatus Methylacidiphilales bacterium]
MFKNKLIIKFLVVSSIIILSFQTNHKTAINEELEKEILAELDASFLGVAGKFYPKKTDSNVLYNFFIDLEHSYFLAAGNKIHLFADSKRWVIIFEVNGYNNRLNQAQIQLIYIGNCIKYSKEKNSNLEYISNIKFLPIIDELEFEKAIENQMNNKFIKIRNKNVRFENDYKKYEKLGIKINDSNDTAKISLGEFIRYLQETNPAILNATQKELKANIPENIPYLTTINEYQYVSIDNKELPPSKQETFLLIAQILTGRNIAKWQPTLKANNHWSNWMSGNF